jgi:hypothetical protein
MRHDTDFNTWAGDWLIGTARNNPEALLVLAAGAALLVRGASRHSQRELDEEREDEFDEYQSDEVGTGRRDGRQRSGGTQSRARSRQSGLSSIAETAGEYASNVKDRVAETASSYASTVSEYAESGRRQFTRQASRLGKQAQSTAGYVLHEQPLAVAALGLAAGAALAALVPPTRLEQRNLRPAHDALSKAASRAAETAKETVGEIGKHLRQRAGEGLKDIAVDTVKTVASTVSAKSDNGASGNEP